MCALLPFPSQTPLVSAPYTHTHAHTHGPFCHTSPDTPHLQVHAHAHLVQELSGTIAPYFAGRTYVDVLRARGYASALVGKWHLENQPPFAQYAAFVKQGSYRSPHVVRHTDHKWTQSRAGVKQDDRHACDFVRDQALTWMRQWHRDGVGAPAATAPKQVQAETDAESEGGVGGGGGGDEAAARRTLAGADGGERFRPFLLHVHFKETHEPWNFPEAYVTALDGAWNAERRRRGLGAEGAAGDGASVGQSEADREAFKRDLADAAAVAEARQRAGKRRADARTGFGFGEGAGAANAGAAGVGASVEGGGAGVEGDAGLGSLFAAAARGVVGARSTVAGFQRRRLASSGGGGNISTSGDSGDNVIGGEGGEGGEGGAGDGDGPWDGAWSGPGPKGFPGTVTSGRPPFYFPEPKSMFQPSRDTAGPRCALPMGWPLETLGARVVELQARGEPFGRGDLNGSRFGELLSAGDLEGARAMVHAKLVADYLRTAKVRARAQRRGKKAAVLSVAVAVVVVVVVVAVVAAAGHGRRDRRAAGRAGRHGYGDGHGGGVHVGPGLFPWRAQRLRQALHVGRVAPRSRRRALSARGGARHAGRVRHAPLQRGLGPHAPRLRAGDATL